MPVFEGFGGGSGTNVPFVEEASLTHVQTAKYEHQFGSMLAG